jgi:amino acid transporter
VVVDLWGREAYNSQPEDKTEVALGNMGGSLQWLRRFLVGERLPTARALHERLSKMLALPVFGSDAISSSAYAVEEIMLALALAGSGALRYSTAVAAVIALLFAVVTTSYRQTVFAYPSGGGAYNVARDNLGLYAGLIAASALLVDYVLTVAVSIAAGVAAIVSAAPALAPERILLCLLFIWLIAIGNLRGVRESGRLFAGPTYLFVASAVLLLLVGLVRQVLSPGTAAEAAMPYLKASQGLGVLLLLRAFASGCAALTGIEAISNAVPAFKQPESKNAATTLLWMGVICIALFVGITAFAQWYHIVPDKYGHETVLSRLGRAVFGTGFLYYALQVATAAVLLLAANTSFTGFPRLASVLARDRLAPRQLANLGDRLVFNNGIVLLAAFASALIIRFEGMTHALIPLYAVGVFISFTLSQAGMVVRLRRMKPPRWRVAAAVNAVGALMTAVVLLVVASVKFRKGAWIVLVVIPLLILAFRKVAQHYRDLGEALTLEGYQTPRAMHHQVLVLVPGLHRGVVQALLYARSLSPDCEAVFVEIDPQETARVKEKLDQLPFRVPLTVLKSPWRSLTQPIIEYIRTIRAEKKMDLVTVVLPEFATTRWWHPFLHNQSGLTLKIALMNEPGVVVTNVRYKVERKPKAPDTGATGQQT